VDKKVAVRLKTHPAYPWFSRVKGVGNENIAKVVALVDIEVDDTISSLWSFAGFAPGSKRVRGQKLLYNAQLKVMCFRLGTSLLRAGLRMQCGGCTFLFGSTTEEGEKREHCPKCGSPLLSQVAVSKYAQKYMEFKSFYEERCRRDGIKIVPATQLPVVEGKKVETASIMSEGHIHAMALRKMIKLFLANLWLVWRTGLGLSTRPPYAEEYLQHSHIIAPEEMVDKPAKIVKKSRVSKRANRIE